MIVQTGLSSLEVFNANMPPRTSSSCRILPIKKNFDFIMISVGKTFVALLSMKTSAAVPIRKSSVLGINTACWILGFNVKKLK